MSKPVFTTRNLIALVFDDFAINTLQIAEHFGVSKDLAYKGASVLAGTVFSNDFLDGGERGPVDNVPANRRKYPVIWQCNLTYDDHELQESLDVAVAKGLDLDKEIK